MKKKLTNNLILKISALVTAMLLWASVQLSEDAVIEKSYNITVDYINAEYLDQNDLYLKEYPRNVTIQVSAKTSAFKNIRAERFTATADLSKRYGDDMYNKSVVVRITADAAIENSLLSMTCKSGDYLDIVLGDIQEKTFPVRVMTEGELPEGMHLSQDGFTVTPSQITVRGPDKIFSNLNQVAVKVNLTDFDGDVLTVEGTPVLYDNENKPISVSNLTTFSAETVLVSTEILKTKTISVSFEGVNGTPAEGYRYSGMDCDLETVEVVGMKADLAEVTNIMIPKTDLDISGATKDRTLVMDISQYLPPDITLYGTEGTATVTLYIEELKEKGYRINPGDIKINGREAGYEYEILNNSVLVTLEGFLEDLEELSAEEIEASIDLSMYEPGLYNDVLVMVTLRDGFTVVNSPKVQVRITDPAISSTEETPETESETETTEDTEEETSSVSAEETESVEETEESTSS